MRWIALALVALSPFATTLAFEAEAKIAEYNQLRPECRQAEDANGQPISTEQSAASCEALNVIGKELSENGYCFDKSEQEWAICPAES